MDDGNFIIDTNEPIVQGETLIKSFCKIHDEIIFAQAGVDGRLKCY